MDPQDEEFEERARIWRFTNAVDRLQEPDEAARIDALIAETSEHEDDL